MATQVTEANADQWERDALALVGRSVQLVLPNPNDSGIVLAAILRHHYLHEPLQECIDDCDLDELALDSTRIDAINAIKQATDVTLKDVKVPMDGFLSQQQLFKSLCRQVKYQASNCPCGEPTAIFAHALLALVESVPQLISTAVSGGIDELKEQIHFLTPVFQKIVAGKLFDQCRFHSNCCQSAQTHMTMAFFIIALESYATQCDLYTLGLLPFLVKSLRSSDLNCKTSALRLVWLALAAKIEPEDIEAAYVHGASTSKQLQEKGAQEGLLNSGFVAIEEMMRLQRADITLAEISVITQLATSAVLWPSTKPALLDRRLPWKLFSQLLVEVLRLPIANTDPFQKDRLVLPTKGCLQLDDLIPDAMCLLSALTGTFLNAMRLQGKEPEHFKDYILPLVMTTLQKHYQQPWGGILVLLLASFMGQLGRGVILKLKKEVPQESFQDAVWTGLNTDVMTRLLGPADTETRKNNKQMRGLCYAVLCNGYRPSAAQTRTIDTVLVAWHLTEAWLPGRVGHKAKLQMLQDWLNKNLQEHPWLEHMHKHWCQQQFSFEKEAVLPQPADAVQADGAAPTPAATSSAPKSAKSSVTRAKAVVQDPLTLSNDDILSYHDQATSSLVQVDRAVLQTVKGNSERSVDGSVFKKQLKMDKPLIEEQCKIVHKLFDAFVRHLTELKWNVFSGTPKTPVMLAKFWSASGFEAISDTISAVTLQARARGISAADCSEISILTAFHNKVLEQKVMVGKVIDTCQSRLLSWSLSSSQLIQTAKEAAAPPPRTCPNHPNGCPKPGTLVQPQAAAQPQAVATKVAAQSQPQGSTAQAQTSPAATPPSASARGVSKQAAQPKAVAGATATSTEHLQSAADRQKQLDDKYAAINAQQAVVQPGTPPPPPAASSSKDDGTIEVQDCEWLWPKYNLLLKQLRALHEKAQADLVRKVAAKKHFMSALQITNPTGYDMVHKIFNAKPNKAPSHPNLGEAVDQLALAYSLFKIATESNLSDPDVHRATYSYRSLSSPQKQGMKELMAAVSEALLQGTPAAEAACSSKTAVSPVPGEAVADTSASGPEDQPGTPADQQSLDGDACEHKPAKKPGAKERKKVAAAMKAQKGEHGNSDTDAAAGPSDNKLADKQQHAATAVVEAESPSTIAAHRPSSAGAVKAATEQPVIDDKGKRSMQQKASPQPDAKPAKQQAAAPAAATAASGESTAAPAAEEASAQPTASTSSSAQLAGPDESAGANWFYMDKAGKKKATAAKEAEPELEAPIKLSKKQRAAAEKVAAAEKAAAEAMAAGPSTNNTGATDVAAPLSAVPEEGLPTEAHQDPTDILRNIRPVCPPTRIGAERVARRSAGDWNAETQQVVLVKPKPKNTMRQSSDTASHEGDSDQQLKAQAPVVKMAPKPQPRKKRAIAEAKSANADSVDAGEAIGQQRKTDDQICAELDADYTCPITQDLFSDPVVAADDNTYERSAIEDWLSRKHISPLTNLPLAHTTLVPNTKIKESMAKLLKQLSPGRHADL